MRLSLCNEVLREHPIEAQFDLAASMGYTGLEIAPFTLAADPRGLGAPAIRAVRAAATASGIAVSGLHWLLVSPQGLSITSDDATVRADTLEVLRACVDLCAELGGEYLVHGSPAQRRLPAVGPGGAGAPEREAARARALDALAAAAERAEAAGVSYCLEPLAPPQDNLAVSVAEALAIVTEVGSPALRTMLDCRAARVSAAETDPPDVLIRRWVPGGAIAHVQVNDSNRRGPGQGSDDFAPLLGALRAVGYPGWIGVEPFEYVPDGPACAAFCAGYMRGIAEALSGVGAASGAGATR